jgi:hypothetical protein
VEIKRQLVSDGWGAVRVHVPGGVLLEHVTETGYGASVAIDQVDGELRRLDGGGRDQATAEREGLRNPPAGGR